jgi:hypothetical protein
LLEQIANATRPNADEHLNEVGARHREEWTSGLTSHGFGEECFAGARRPDEQSALR